MLCAKVFLHHGSPHLQHVQPPRVAVQVEHEGAHAGAQALGHDVGAGGGGGVGRGIGWGHMGAVGQVWEQAQGGWSMQRAEGR